MKIATQTFMSESGVLEVELGFDPLPINTQYFDFDERANGGYKIFDINISGKESKYAIDSDLLGNYHSTDGSAMWLLGLYPELAIYKDKFWEYKPNSSKGEITLQNRDDNSEVITLYYKSKKTGLMIGESPNSMQQLSRERIFNNNYTIPAQQDRAWSQEGYITSGKAVIRGYFAEYSPKLGFSRGSVYVRNGYKHSDKTFLLKINPDGSFECELEIDHPTDVGLQFKNSFLPVFVSPGDTLIAYYSLKDILHLKQSVEPSLNRRYLWVRLVF
ncbi:MAG: hypothetical protein R3Y04_09040 [Rikenellaceae bacterium]